MKLGFIKFTEVNSPFRAKVTVRQKTGQIGFSSGAVNKYGISKYTCLVMYYAPEDRIVGLQLTNDESAEGAIRIVKRKANNYFSAKNFLDCFGVDYTHSTRFDLERDAETGMLYFCLDKGEKAEDELVDDNHTDESTDTSESSMDELFGDLT